LADTRDILRIDSLRDMDEVC